MQPLYLPLTTHGGEQSESAVSQQSAESGGDKFVVFHVLIFFTMFCKLDADLRSLPGLLTPLC